MDSETSVQAAAEESAAVAFALAQVGKPYVFGAIGPDEFDCSGLVVAALKKLGLALPHNSSQQVSFFQDKDAAAKLGAPRTDLVPGDVIFWYGSMSKPASVTHCALYVGRSPTGKYMVVAAVDENYGVKKHRMRWALKECGYGYTHKVLGN
jgi:cell wall-associated NlpC family hydrolase